MVKLLLSNLYLSMVKYITICLDFISVSHIISRTLRHATHPSSAAQVVSGNSSPKLLFRSKKAMDINTAKAVHT